MGGSSQKIKIEEVRAVVTRADSLTVMTEDNKPSKKYFAQVMIATPTMHLYYKYKFMHWGPGPTMAIGVTPVMGATGTAPRFANTLSWKGPSGQYPSTKQVPMYQEGNTTFELTKSNFITVLTKALADVPDLVQRIQNKEFKFALLEEIVNLYFSKSHYKGN